MTDENTMGLAQLKTTAVGFDRAQMRDVHIVKDGEDHLSKKYMGIWNLDKDELATLAPKSYTVIQHRRATEALIEALTALNIKATASLKQSRHGVHIDFDFPEVKLELTQVGESFTTGIRMVSDYSQVAGLVIAARVTRLACSNGMIVNELVKPKRIKFTEEMTLTIEGVIDKIIRDIIASDDKLANQISVCMRDSIEWQALRLLTKALFKKPRYVRAILSRIKTDTDGRVTRWNLYNAVTNFVSRSGARLSPQVDTWLQNKAQKIFKTSLSDMTEELVKVEQTVSEEGDTNDG